MENDEGVLRKLGYAQDLLREMGGFSSFAVSFSIISVLTGCITTYGDALGPGGPAGVGIGWPLVSFGTLAVAVAMAELASAFPTAGALYHWSSLLGGPGWGWFTAIMNLVGQVAIVGAIDLGCAKELSGMLGLTGDRAASAVFLLVLASHVALNALRVRVVARLNDLSATVHILGVVVVVAALVTIGKVQPFSFLFQTGFTTRTDGSYGLGFANALILSMYTFTGYDASAHLSEETKHPERKAPWGIVLSVAVSAVAGYALLLGLTLAIANLPQTAADEHPALFILQRALGSLGGRSVMALAIVAMWFCGLSSLTSASRTLWAFSRDGGLPLSTFLAHVHTKFRTPVRAIVALALAAALLVLGTQVFSSGALLVVAQVATMGLYVSYGIPIGLGAIARQQRRWVKLGPWNVGRAGVPLAWFSVAWVFGVLAVCTLPPNVLAGKLLAIALVVISAIWLVWVRGRFQGPKVSLETFQR